MSNEQKIFVVVVVADWAPIVAVYDNHDAACAAMHRHYAQYWQYGDSKKMPGRWLDLYEACEAEGWIEQHAYMSVHTIGGQFPSAPPYDIDR